MAEPICYLDGRYLPLSKAAVGITDIGLLRGFGVYDGLTTYNNKVFRFDEHFARLKKSADALSLSLPISEKELEKILTELIKRNGFSRTNFRVILTGGQTIAGIEFQNKKETFYIIAEPYKSLEKSLYDSGGSLFTFEHKRQYPEYKTINYITGVMLQARRKAEGAIEVLYVSDGLVLEAATSNFFLVKGKTLITPRKGVLLGITRNTVIDLMAKDFKIEERDLEVSEITDADEAFITASYKEVVPIVRIDNHTVGMGNVGPVSAEVMRRFKDYTKRWGTVDVPKEIGYSLASLS